MSAASESPVFHLHVRVAEVGREGDRWLALFEEPDGRRTWMEQPAEPTVGDEQVLYIVRKGSAECARLRELVESGATPEQVEAWLHSVARRYGAWCEKTWNEARAAGGGGMPEKPGPGQRIKLVANKEEGWPEEEGVVISNDEAVDRGVLTEDDVTGDTFVLQVDPEYQGEYDEGYRVLSARVHKWEPMEGRVPEVVARRGVGSDAADAGGPGARPVPPRLGSWGARGGPGAPGASSRPGPSDRQAGPRPGFGHVPGRRPRPGRAPGAGGRSGGGRRG